jgi:nucleoside-diphosphate-sugar epimerase
MFSPHAEVLIGDITDRDAVQSAMQGVDAVIHMAALLHIMNPQNGLREKYEHVNIGGTATVVETAIKTGVGRVVLFSTIAVYGQAHGQVLNEDSLTRPETCYAQTKLTAEEIVLNARRADGVSIGTVLRLGAVYGSRIKGNYERMVRALACNRFIPVGGGLNRRTLVYDKDVAIAAVLAVENLAAPGRIYNVTDGNFHTLNEIISAICKALGRKPPRFSLSIAPVRFVAGILEDGARLYSYRSPVTRATINKYTEDIAIESNRIRKELGFVPQYDLDAGWQETIREMRERGIL